MPGLTRCSRSSTASTTSAGEASMRRYIPASVVAGSQHSRSSLIAGPRRRGLRREPVGPPVGDHPWSLTPFDLYGAPAEDQEPAAFGPDLADGAPDPDLLAGQDRADE